MKDLLGVLQLQSYQEEIHGLAMTIKPVPDPIPETVMDPRSYAYKKKLQEEAEKNGGASMPESIGEMVQMLREEPAYPSRDLTTIEITKEEKTITTRNGQINIYIYKPASEKKDRPAMTFFHGGAYFMGSTKVVENFCKLIVQEADAVVVGVDYQLAPEHQYPVGMYDCYDAFQWVYDNAAELDIDPDRICVGGDSAGGTLAIECCIIERDRVLSGELDKARICYEALVYPAVIVNNVKTDDFRWRLSDYDIPDDDFVAMASATELKGTSEIMAGLYMGRAGKVTDPLAAPLFQETLKGLPKTLMAVCEYDYLRLSDEAFGRKMNRDGVDNRVIFYKGMDHSFVDKVGDCPQAYDVALEIAKDIKAL